MPPFNPRRFDPYGNNNNNNETTTSTLNNNTSSTPITRPSTARTRTLLNGNNSHPVVSSFGSYGGNNNNNTNNNAIGGGGGGGGTTIHDRILGTANHHAGGRGSPNNNGLDGSGRDGLGAIGGMGGLSGGTAGPIKSRILPLSSSGRPFNRPGNYYQEEDHGHQYDGDGGAGAGSTLGYAHTGQFNNNNNNRRAGNVGAAPLSSQVHPLLALKQQQARSGGYYDGSFGGGDRKHTGSNSNNRRRPPPGRHSPGDPRHRSSSHPHGHHNNNNNTRAAHLLNQTRRILSLLLGQIPEQDAIALQKQRRGQSFESSDNNNFETEEEILQHLLSAKSTARTIRLFLLLPMLLLFSKRILPPVADRITRPKPWSWSAGVALPGSSPNDAAYNKHRNLAGRSCVMNYFIEKQPPDEYDPDFVEIKQQPNNNNNEKDNGKDGNGKKTSKAAMIVRPPPVTIVEGTYRTKGQVHVISRFIEAIADSFRSNTKIRQHLIFADSRDGGHLAYEAMRHWPPRGKHKTVVHVLASEDLPSLWNNEKNNDAAGGSSRNAARALGYGSLEDIELKFRGMGDKARVYDRDGNLAGLPEGEGVDDDDEVDYLEDNMDVPDKETLELRMRSGKKHGNRRSYNSTVSLLPDGTKPYPNLRALLPFEEEDDGDGDIVVPYLHVDGISMVHQLNILESARSLLEDRTIVVVGIEHSKDLDVRALIAFFQEVKYKTFFLGARQIARIDNLCEEVLDDVLEHPYVSIPKGSWLRRFFIRLGLISKEELRMVVDNPKEKQREIARELKMELARASAGEVGSDSYEGGAKRRETPPFFVAMPRGRRSKEEMTIQHMYDLFGGYGGGGGQIKTANDRKAPGK